jgi:hypothetical protein
MKFDVLHNFISPVTGRILSDNNYVLLGNRKGIAIPSPIIIDIRLDLIALRESFIKLKDDYIELALADFIIGHPNKQLPNAQVLSSLDDGFVYNTAGVISTAGTIPIGSLPDLANTYLWTGNSSNRPVAVQTIIYNNLPNLTNRYIIRGDVFNRPVMVNDLSVVESSVQGILGDLATLASLINSVVSTVNALEAGLAGVGGFAAIAASFLAIIVLQGQVIGINNRINNLTATFGGDVTGTGFLSSTITLTLGLTLDQIKLATANVNINTHRLINVSDPIDPLDAVNLQTLESYTGSGLITLSGAVNGRGLINTTIVTTLNPVINVSGDSQEFSYGSSYAVTGFSLNNNFAPTFSTSSVLNFILADNSGYGITAALTSPLFTSPATAPSFSLNYAADTYDVTFLTVHTNTTDVGAGLEIDLVGRVIIDTQSSFFSILHSGTTVFDIEQNGQANLNTHKIINMSDPTDPLDGVNLETLISYIGSADLILTDFVIGGPAVAGVIATSRGPTCTLDVIPAAADVTFDDFAIIDLATLSFSSWSDMEAKAQNGINFLFLWQFFGGGVS